VKDNVIGRATVDISAVDADPGVPHALWVHLVPPGVCVCVVCVATVVILLEAHVLLWRRWRGVCAVGTMGAAPDPHDMLLPLFGAAATRSTRARAGSTIDVQFPPPPPGNSPVLLLQVPWRVHLVFVVVVVVVVVDAVVVDVVVIAVVVVVVVAAAAAAAALAIGERCRDVISVVAAQVSYTLLRTDPHNLVERARRTSLVPSPVAAVPATTPLAIAPPRRNRNRIRRSYSACVRCVAV
jgi:hypothetical protein